MQAVLSGSGGEPRNVFDYPEAEPSELFINPFACNTSPLLWRELQVGLYISLRVSCTVLDATFSRMTWRACVLKLLKQ